MLVRKQFRLLKSLFEPLGRPEAAHVTLVLDSWGTSDLNTRIDLRGMQETTGAVLDSISADWQAVIEIAAFQNVRHPLGGNLVTPHVHALVWGPGTIRRARSAATTFNAVHDAPIPALRAAKVSAMGPRWRDWAAVLAYQLKANDKFKTQFVHAVTGEVNLHESEAADRYVRYLRQFQILSLIEQRDLMFARGAGAEVHWNAIVDTEAELYRRGMLGGDVGPREIEAFWDEFMPRMGWSRFQPPLIIPPANSRRISANTAQ